MAPSATLPPDVLRGARHPRVEARPQQEIAYSEADLAIELAERAGLILEPWQCDALELMMSVRPDGRWACFEYFEQVARQQGKGALIEARSLAGLLLLGEAEILWSAHEYKTAMTGFRRMRRHVRQLGIQLDKDGFLWDVDGISIKIHNTHGEEGFERLDTEARIKFIARSKGSGRGFSGDTIFIDEAFAYTDVMHDALIPTLTARPNPQIIYTSTPPLTGDTGDVMYRLKDRAENGKHRRLGYRDWGLDYSLDQRHQLDLDDQSLWAQTCPGLGCGRDGMAETIENLRESMTEEGFARELLCLWPRRNKTGGAIDLKQWRDLTDEESSRAGQIAVGVDVALNRSASAIAIYGPRADELGHLQLMNYNPGTEWIVPTLVKLRDELGPIAVGMGTGTFKSLKTELDAAGFAEPEKPEEPEPGQIAVLGGVDMAAACGQIIDAVRQGSLRHLGQDPLDDAVESAKTRKNGDTIAWHKQDDTDISPLGAATAARWAYITRVDLVLDDRTPNIW